MNNLKELFRVILAVSIIIVGVTHFIVSDQYVRIVPQQLPNPLGLVYLSGFYEILGGIGLLVPPVSQAAAWGLIALFIAVYPANINMAVNHIHIDHIPDSPWVQVVRLPFQAVFIEERQRAEGRRQKEFIPSPECPNPLRDLREQGFKTPTKFPIWWRSFRWG